MKWLRKGIAALLLALSFAWDLVASSFSVARIVLTPGVTTHPAIVAMPISLHTRHGVAAMAYFLSVTPGSTCIHVSDDRKRLFIHLLDVRDPEASIARFRRLYESRIAELER